MFLIKNKQFSVTKIGEWLFWSYFISFGFVDTQLWLE